MILKKISRISIKKNSKIKEAILSLNKSGNQIVLVLDNNKKLIGTITDGDIRRGILKGYKLSDSVSKVLNLNPHITSEKISQTYAVKLMNEKHINHLPLVDKKFRLVDIYSISKHYREKIKKKENIFFIFAGGRGQRLKPYTNNCPKPLLKVRGKPMLQHIIERAKKQGFKNFIISIKYLGKMIQDYFLDGSAFGVKINYIYEKKKLGTAGSLAYLKKKNSNAIIVTNGDVMSEINYSKMLNFHNKNKSDFTLSVFPYQTQNPYGIVVTNDLNVVKIKEKPITQNNINAGVYILSNKICSLIKHNQKIDMIQLIKKVKKRKLKVMAYALHEDWSDVGRVDDYKKIK